METIATLTAKFAKPGKIEWIGLRPERKQPLTSVESVMIHFTGLDGDRRSTPGKRAVTLIQAEHLPVIAALCECDDATIAPHRLRRNIVVSGIPLVALRKVMFKIGGATLMGSGLCAPCSRMETELGYGGYNAMRGHGGICAEVVEEGPIVLGDTVTILQN